MSTQIEEIDAGTNPQMYNTRAVHPLQAWEWGEARKAMGIKTIRLGEYQEQKLINTFQLTVHPIGGGYSIGYLPRSVFPSKACLDFLRKLGRKERLVFIKIEPNVALSDDAGQMPDDMKKSPHPLFPDWTQVLDISAGEEDLLKRMKPKTRYNIRLAEKKGVVVKNQTDEKGYRIFKNLYFETCKRQKYYGHTRKYHQTIFKTLKENIAHILIAYFEDIPLAAYELFYLNGVFYYPYGGSSATHRNLMSANLLMWEAIKLGKKLGAAKFDMWGSLPPDYNPKDGWAGFTRFKEGYGTTFVRMSGSFDLVISPFLYPAYNRLDLIRKQYLTLRKLFLG